MKKIKTTNMGSLIDITYRVTMSNDMVPKEMLDEIRIRNANLSVMICNADVMKPTL